MKIKLMSILNNLLGKPRSPEPLDMKGIFSGSGFSEAPRHAYKGYPTPLPPDAVIEAYLVRFLVSEENLSRLFLMFEKAGYVVNPGQHTQVMERSQEPIGKKVMLFLHPSFSGTVVSCASDDLDVLEALQQTRLDPPLPADSFPWIDPEGLGSLQGDIEYWWMHLWLPFWVSLNQEEQLSLELEPEWREFIENHQPSPPQ
jgi:hypothetical protein